MDLIARPFGYVMQFCASICFNNYALALLLFALIVKIVLLPFGIKQQKTQIRTAKLRPKIAAIEKKYAGRKDRPTLQKKQQEILELQQNEGVSPMGGCLPLLIQLPILLGLYNVVRAPLTYLMHASGSTIDRVIQRVAAVVPDFAGKTAANVDQLELVSAIEHHNIDVGGLLDIDKLPSFDLFGIDISVSPIDAFGWLLLIPLASAVLSYFTMRLSRRYSGQAQMMAATTGDEKKSTTIMDLIMPLISAFFSFTYTATLGLYWVYQSLFGLLQTFVLAKAMPLPTFTDADLKRAEKEMKIEEAKAKPIKIRSLHHIDDDEEEEAYVASASGVSSVYGDEEEQALSEEGDRSVDTKTSHIETAPLKKDDRPKKEKKKK